MWRRLALSLALSGLLGASGAVALAQDMAFKLVTVGNLAKCGSKCIRIIAGEGEIVAKTPGDFLAFINDHIGDTHVRSLVMLHSPGGSVVASMQLGLLLRQIGAATVVARVRGTGEGTAGSISAGRCYSACVYALMGGRRRIVPVASEIGVHRSYSLHVGNDPGHEFAISRVEVDDGKAGAAIARYCDLMGISRDLVAMAQKTQPDDIHILTRDEIRRWRLGSPKF